MGEILKVSLDKLKLIYDHVYEIAPDNLDEWLLWVDGKDSLVSYDVDSWIMAVVECPWYP
jgi:hypothetical protein